MDKTSLSLSLSSRLVSSRVYKLVKNDLLWISFIFGSALVSFSAVFYTFDYRKGLGDWHDVFYKDNQNGLSFSIDHYIDKYQHWSSRGPIEFLFVFLADKIVIWSIISAILVTLVYLITYKWICQSKLDTSQDMHKIAVPLLVLMLFPLFLDSSAGVFATSINNLWPMTLAICALYLLCQKNTISKLKLCAAILCLSFCCFQEQTTVSLLIISVYQMVKVAYHYFSHKVRPANLWRTILLFGFSFVGALNAVLCPGNKTRSLAESKRMPGFLESPVYTKVFTGFTHAVFELTNTFQLPLVLLVVVILAYSLLTLKKDIFFYVVVSSFVFVMLLINQAFIKDGLTNGYGTLVSLHNKRQILLLIVCVLLFACLVFFAYKIRDEFITVALFVGFASEMMMSFSPTVFASSSRTFTILIVSMYLCVLRMMRLIIARSNAESSTITGAVTLPDANPS